MELEILKQDFSVCRVADDSRLDLSAPFCFVGKTDEENSLVCPTGAVPQNALAREDGWRAFRIRGVLDFSLIGILARISALLAQAGVGIFAVSTYNTDYIFTKGEDFPRALEVLAAAGYRIVQQGQKGEKRPG